MTAVGLGQIQHRPHYFVNEKNLILIGPRHLDWRDYRDDFELSTAFSVSIKTGDIKQLLTPGGGLSGKSRVTRGQTGMGKVVGSTADGKHLFIPAFVSRGEYDSAPKYALLKVKTEGGRPRIGTPVSTKARDYFVDGAGNLLARESLGDRSDAHSIEVS